jgi:tetratricopeptide (TPR) repeat protein
MYALSTERRAGHVRPRWGALPDVATSFINIGAVYEGKGDFENALVQYQKGLEIKTRAFGSDHLDVAESYNNIGLVYDRQGKYDEAMEYYQKDLDITVRLVGRRPPGRGHLIPKSGCGVPETGTPRTDKRDGH